MQWLESWRQLGENDFEFVTMCKWCVLNQSESAVEDRHLYWLRL